MTETIQCNCVAEGLPLWGYCDDDLFCPLCGSAVARLKFNSDRVDLESPLVIYNQPEMGFVFDLSLDYGFQDRSVKSRIPLIDVEKSSLFAQAWFHTRMRVPTTKAGNRFFCELIPRRTLDATTLPVTGLESEIILEGDFGKKKFSVLICNSPKIVVELSGNGIEREQDQQHWKVWLPEVLELELKIRATTAPVVIAEEMSDILVNDPEAEARGSSPVSIKLKDTLRAGTRLWPAEDGVGSSREWTSGMILDARNFGQAGRTCQLALDIKVQGIDHVEQQPLTLSYVDSGRLVFWPEVLTIPLAYLGEERSNSAFERINPEPIPVIPKWEVQNKGQQDITIRIVAVNDKSRLDQDVDAPLWVTVKWADDKDLDDDLVQPNDDGEVTLSPNDRAQLYVRINLGCLNEATFKDGNDLRAEVVFADERDKTTSATIQLNRVRHRKCENTPLAIDFGNTHSFAAMLNPGDMPKPFDRSDIIPVHELRHPDSYPTAIYFESVADRDNPDYCIGLEALELGSANPEGLVTDLKRWIGHGGVHHVRTVVDRADHRARYDIEELVVLYLRELIRQAENVIRKQRIREVGISYPATFGPERRRALDRILAQLTAGSPNQPVFELATGGAAIDEANAAILHCVLSSEFQEQHTELLERGRFTIASVDWGGGSLDTAVLEVTVEGQVEHPTFSSHYLAIGGDEHFGGDNMTISVMELLLDTMRELLALVIPEGAWETLVPTPAERDVAKPAPQRNFNALWLAAESVKQHQSNFWNRLPGDERLEELRKVLRKQLVEDFNYRLSGNSVVRKEGHSEDERQNSARRILQAAIDEDRLLVSLETAWTRPIRADFEEDKGYSIDKRFRQYLKQLVSHAGPHRGPGPANALDVVVICGSASRLPLVEPLVRDVCPDAEIIHDSTLAKRRVAFGIVRYIDAHRDHELARSCDYTNAAFGLIQRGDRKRLLTIIPACSPVNKPSVMYRILEQGKNKGSPILLGRFIQNDQLELYREETPLPRCIGYFDLSLPPAGSTTPLDDLRTGTPVHGQLRLGGAESQIELFLTIGATLHGPWSLFPKDQDK